MDLTLYSPVQWSAVKTKIFHLHKSEKILEKSCKSSLFSAFIIMTEVATIQVKWKKRQQMNAVNNCQGLSVKRNNNGRKEREKRQTVIHMSRHLADGLLVFWIFIHCMRKRIHLRRILSRIQDWNEMRKRGSTSTSCLISPLLVEPTGPWPTPFFTPAKISRMLWYTASSHNLSDQQPKYSDSFLQSTEWKN